jgi:hypothetical protein
MAGSWCARIPGRERRPQMRMLRYVLFALFATLIYIPQLAARTAARFDTSFPGVVEIPDATDLVNQVQDKADLNGPIIADSFAMGNITGYPVGKATIGTFPHFQVGVAMGAGMTNMRYFDDSRPESDNGSLPGITPNPVLHFGVGLGGGFDIIGKYFSLSKAVVDPGVSADIAKLSDYKLLSMGAKLRYNIVEKKKLLPFIFNFGGVTISLGGDFMYGDIKVTGDYEVDFNDITVEVGGAPNTITANFDGEYNARVLWSIFSLTAQAVAYFDVFYLFSFYTGFGLTGNVGYFKMRFGGTGDLTSEDPPISGAPYNGEMGTLIFESINTYQPYYAIPTYLLGLEINLWVLKVTGETMVNLYNRKDVNATVGVRVQF